MGRVLQPDLFADEPRGFVYRPELLTCAEERVMIDRIAPLPFKPFEFGPYLGKRRVVSFGWRYDYGEHVLKRAGPIPGFLTALRERAAELAGLAPDRLEQALVTEYQPGVQIGWHRDRPDFEEVVGVSLASPAILRLRRRAGAGWERSSQRLEPRSAYVLAGEARNLWEHSIPPVEKLRYSVTFRSCRSRLA